MKRQRCSAPISLPDDVITEILLKLPVKSIHRFRSVSKTWFSVLSSPNFTQLYLNHAMKQDKSSIILSDFMIERSYLIDSYSLASDKSLDLMDHPFISVSESKIYIVGYCNGLVSYSSSSDDRYHIWNPSTNEYKTLPVSPCSDVKKLPITAVSCGLGYDWKIDDYKFLVIYSASDGDNFFSGVMVHALGSGTWNTIENIAYKVFNHGCGVFLNGALHWIGTCAAVVGKRCSYDVILSFDMVEESVKDVPLPKELNEKPSLSLSMGVLRDHLCIFDNNKSNFQTEVWVMKEEYGDQGSWSKLFSIQTDNDAPFSYYLKPIKCFNDGLMLLQKGKTDLVLYDQKQKSLTKLSYLSHAIQAISCVGSLVSLNSRTYLKQEFHDPM